VDAPAAKRALSKYKGSGATQPLFDGKRTAQRMHADSRRGCRLLPSHKHSVPSPSSPLPFIHCDAPAPTLPRPAHRRTPTCAARSPTPLAACSRGGWRLRAQPPSGDQLWCTQAGAVPVRSGRAPGAAHEEGGWEARRGLLPGVHSARAGRARWAEGCFDLGGWRWLVQLSLMRVEARWDPGPWAPGSLGTRGA
jgi:hypothetical protein